MVTMAELNARLDIGLERRAWIHRLREKKRIDVQNYKGGLKAVRDLEDELEPQRTALGAKYSRAIEKVTVKSDGYYEPEGAVSMSDESSELELDEGGGAPVDPFAEVPADAGAEPAEGQLGGDGATLEDLQAEQEQQVVEPEPGEFLEEPEAAAEPEPEPINSAPEAAEAKAEEAVSKAAPAAVDGEEEEKPKKGTSIRHYAVLLKNEETGEWSEPFAEEGGIQASNGEIALREAYNRLVPEEQEKQIELVCFPTHYWKPRKVGAKAKIRRSVTIE
jgi:hypothetical protein